MARDIAQAYAEELQDLVARARDPAGRDQARRSRPRSWTTPQVSDDAVSPQPLRNLALAAVLGLLLGIGLAVARELLDTR